jgi:hypothetical protein
MRHSSFLELGKIGTRRCRPIVHNRLYLLSGARVDLQINGARCVESTGAQLIGAWTIDFDESWRIGVASHIRQEAKRKAVAALDNVTIGELEDQRRRLEKTRTKTN